MSILIKGMDMPKCCDRCPCNGYDDMVGLYCRFWFAPVSEPTYKDEDGPAAGCPLVEIPTPHGRLIDADELQAYDGTEWGTPDDVVMSGDIFGAPTIIEAEE